MGVLGLWDIITLSGQSRSLTHLAVVDGFDSNASSKRAYRVGIDASIWYKHAAFSKGGENPELRLLFFRAVKLAELPLLPLFVFDGRERPKVKRGSKMGKAGSHALTSGMKEILDAFGFEWRMAPGEAEAELAYLNRTGIIDAIMTDDVDAFVFGATTIIRNSSLQLSGNKSNPALDSNGKPSSHHVMVFKASVIATHPGIGLSRGGMVLFALLTGGDYDKGVDKFGKTIAHALARCGFGDQLLRACERRQEESLHLVLPRWRAAVNMELATDSCGFLGRTYPRLQLPDAFPDLKLLENYATPVCSAKLGRQGGGAMRGTGEMNLGRIAAFCEKYFEWGTRTLIVKRFRDLLWEAAVIRILRRAALEADEKEIERRIAAGNMDRHVRGPLRPERRDAVGTPATLVKKYLNISAADLRAQAFANRGPQGNHAQAIPDPHPLIVKIHSSRQHVSTDKIVEYRLEIAPHQLVDLTRSGIIGKRPDVPQAPSHDDFDDIGGSQEVAKKKKGGTPPDPLSPLRMWCPASMLWQVHPALVEDFEFGAEEKKRKKDERGKGKGKGKKRAADSELEETDDEREEAPATVAQKALAQRTNAAGPSNYPATSETPLNVPADPRPPTYQPAQALPRPPLARPAMPLNEPPGAQLSVTARYDNVRFGPASTRGFLWAFSDPDNPDALPPCADTAVPDVGFLAGLASARREVTFGDDADNGNEEDQYADEEDEEMPLDPMWDRLFEQVMMPGGPKGKAASTSKAAGKKRARVSDAGLSTTRHSATDAPAVKKRKSVPAPVTAPATQQASTSSSSFVSQTSRRHTVTPPPAPPLFLSSPPVARAHPKDTSAVIVLESDSDSESDGLDIMLPSSSQTLVASQPPSSSPLSDVNKGKRTYRGSSFGGGSSFSKDVEMVIDLT